MLCEEWNHRPVFILLTTSGTASDCFITRRKEGTILVLKKLPNKGVLRNEMLSVVRNEEVRRRLDVVKPIGEGVMKRRVR